MGNLWKIPVTWKLKVSINFWKARAIDRIIHPSYIFNLRVPSIEKITSDPRLLR